MPVEEVYLYKISTDAEGKQERTRIESPAGELTLAHGANEVGVGCHATMKGSLDPIDDMKVQFLAIPCGAL